MTDSEFLEILEDENLNSLIHEGNYSEVQSRLQSNILWPKFRPKKMVGYVGLQEPEMLGGSLTEELMAVVFGMMAHENVGIKVRGNRIHLGLSSVSGIDWNQQEVSDLAEALLQDEFISQDLRDRIIATRDPELPEPIDMKQFERIVEPIRQLLLT